MTSLRALVLLLALATTSIAQPVRLRVQPDSRITLRGTSNVHKWECWTNAFEARIDVPAGTPAQLGSAIDAMEIVVPVDRLECDRKGIAENLRKAMDSKQHPTVRFRMTSYTATPKSTGYEGVVRGSLTIKSTTKPTTLRATVTPDGGGGVRAEGTTVLETTEYGVSAVKALMGTIKTSTRVTVAVVLHARQP